MNSYRLAASLRRFTATSIVVALCNGALACTGDRATAPAPTPSSTSTPSGGFTLSAAPTVVALLQGGGGESMISIARNSGFSGSVAFVVSGAPDGVTATVDPWSTTGATATLTIATKALVPAGTVTLTIIGSSADRPDQEATATVVIAPYEQRAGNVAVDFRSCPVTEKPVWFAFQDGAGGWRQVIGSEDVYRFSIESTKGGYAYTSGRMATSVSVALATQGELTRATIGPCGSSSRSYKRLFGTTAGLGPGEVAYVGMGGGYGDPEGGTVGRNFSLPEVPEGPQDLFAYRSLPSAFSPRERVIVRRDLDIANAGMIDPIDFDSNESVPPATAALTVTGDSFGAASHYMSYFAGPACSYHDLYGDATTGANQHMRGIPSALQRPTDFHALYVYTNSPYRYAYEFFHTLADREVALPEALPAPTMSFPPGGHRRVQAKVMLPSEYDRSLYLLWTNYGSTASASVKASFGWLGGRGATLTLPDFSGVSGWRRSFLPASEKEALWFLVADGANDAATKGACTEGARFVTAYASGWQ